MKLKHIVKMVAGLLALYVVGISALAALSVGQPMNCDADVYTWSLLVGIFLLLFTPAVLGVLLGSLVARQTIESQESRHD